MLTRREWVALPLVAAGCGRGQPSAIERAARFLWNQQSEDGGWHSRTYGLLRSGQSLTGFVLDSLLRAPDLAPKGGVNRALAFLDRHTDPEGAIGRKDPALADYPNYGTACAGMAFARAKRDPSRLIAWLRTQQFSEQTGWKPADPAFGAWGMGGSQRVAPFTGHVDLSMTRHVLQALAAAGVREGDAAFERAKIFVERCQNPDGGFFFSTVVLEANKAGHDGDRYRSYGTATADGILSLLAMGYPVAHPRVQSARGWLQKHHRPDGASGFTTIASARWTVGLRFYYAAMAAEAFRRSGLEPPPHDLERTQRPDGSWVNSENLVKEDDPLIATSFAIRALAK
jgi:prenyltransferase beta subunit